MARGAGGGLVRIGGRNPNPSSGAGRGGAEWEGGRGVWFVGSGGLGSKRYKNDRGLSVCGRGWFLKTSGTGGVTLSTGP
jgi:hypothetical protein